MGAMGYSGEEEGGVDATWVEGGDIGEAVVVGVFGEDGLDGLPG